LGRGWLAGSLTKSGCSQEPTAHATMLRQMLRAALIRRRQQFSATVQPGCFNFSQWRVGPGSYVLAWSLARSSAMASTKPRIRVTSASGTLHCVLAGGVAGVEAPEQERVRVLLTELRPAGIRVLVERRRWRSRR